MLNSKYLFFRKSLLTFSFVMAVFLGRAGTISGTIRSAAEAKPLAFSSVLIKGSTKGVSANSNGFYTINLDPGEYILVAQFVGYSSVEKKIRLSDTAVQVNFELTLQQYHLREVLVKSGGEDPAYSIIRNAIKNRETHLREIKQFSCEVYIKGQLQLRNYPASFMGQKVDFEDGDTSKRKMIFLSETLAKYSVEEPDKRKVEVLSTKVSGRSDGFGFSSPQIISFYENTISIGRSLNPRGFISPVASNALSFYNYKFEGTFYESGKEISRIKVTPRRAYEPLFTGYIHISENDWRIQSVDLKLLRSQQLQLLDTLVIQQQYIPVASFWVIKNQVIFPSGKFLGFDFFGSFLQVYDQFNLNPGFKPKYFNNTVLKFADSSNKKTLAYWDSIRPLPLMKEELRDYQQKDSLEIIRKDPRYLDSLDRIRNKFRLSSFLLTGQSISVQKKKTRISFPSLASAINYNTVEGGVVNYTPGYFKEYTGRKTLAISPVLRYGFANKQFSPSITASYNFGKKYLQNFSVAAGRKVFQYNNSSPVSERLNSLYTLLAEYNYLKIYSADFIKLSYSGGIGNGLRLNANFQFQDRSPLSNLDDMVSWKDYANRQLTPNFPAELTSSDMKRNQAAVLTLGINWKPGSRYIEYPDRTVDIGSRFPTISASVSQGINGLLGSDVDYTKWRVSINDALNLKLLGKLNYNLTAGGFISAAKTFIPDYQHFNGNQTFLAAEFLNSFQLAPYYRYSNTAGFSATAHIEYHLNGFISNKIPGFKKLNWFFVTGLNALYADNGTSYQEYFWGIENIFKVLRVDYIQGVEKSGGRPSGFRIAVPLFR